MLEAGELGDVLHFRGRYLQEWGTTTADAWRFHKDEAGSGALGDLGAHVIDLARYLVGEIASVSASMRTFMDGPRGRRRVRGGRRVRGRRARDDRGDALRRRPQERVQLGDQRHEGLARVRPGASQRAPALATGTKGFRTILVSEADHPFWQWWWPHGHMIGWEHTFVHEIHHLLTAIAGDGDVAPHGATFEDGYRAAEVCDAIVRSSESGRREAVTYR